VHYAFAYLLLRHLFQLMAGSSDHLNSDLEVVVLRHQLMVLKRKAGRPRLRRRDRLSETLARIPPDSDVLELGCSAGIDAVALAERGRYTGVDLSPVMLSLAQERVPSGAFLRHDLTSLEMPEGSCDAVVALYGAAV
jgi:ubiquinone/menaquinone biosynthesis C-methylase UbiE